LQGLVVVGIGARAAPSAAGAAASSRESGPIFQARSINHVTLYVSGVARSKAFYQSLTGRPVRAGVRYDKRADIHEGFLSLGCALICWQSLR
jgi:hypothetical protein